MNKAKAYLSEIRSLKKLADSYEEKIEVLRIKAAGIKGVAYDKDKVQVSQGHAMDDDVIALMEAEKEYKAILVKYHEAVLIRTKQIAMLDNPDYVQILLMRYVMEREMKLEEIAEEMYLSFDRVAHLHGEALDAFGRKFGDMIANNSN